jgi:hypothetical protein
VTLRFTKGKARTETPRVKDLSVSVPERDPSEGRDASGRFLSGNPHGIGQGFKATIRRSLGSVDNASPEAAEVVRSATKLYLALLRSLPSDGPAVRQLVAAQARHAAIATFYSNEGARVGLATKEGLAFAEAARAHDTTAQRLSVTAYDRAVREAAAKPAPVEQFPWMTDDEPDEPAADAPPASDAPKEVTP